MKTINTLVLILALTGCARSQIKTPTEAMRPTAMPELKDDLEFSGLIKGLKANIKFLREKQDQNAQFVFGMRQVDRASYLKALEFLIKQSEKDISGEAFRKAVSENFEAFEVYGQKDWGDVFITSYFEPVISGSLKPKGNMTQPLYALPKDLVDIDLPSFIEPRPALSSVVETITEQRSRRSWLRGRLLPAGEEGRLTPRIVAFPNRARIDEGAIQKSAKVLVYVDPIDAFILEIQGSGVVRLKSGQELKVGYAAQNGHPYVAIGQFLFDAIPKEKMSLQAIENHLRSLPLGEARKIMQQNPSYVFFQKVDTGGITFLGTGLNVGRTIATDQTFFPKGALGFLEFEQPVFDSPTALEPVEWKKTSRFVIDQDTGGAIRGPHRVDLFAGRGAEAKQVASVMKNRGRLVYLVPKESLLTALNEKTLSATRAPTAR